MSCWNKRVLDLYHSVFTNTHLSIYFSALQIRRGNETSANLSGVNCATPPGFMSQIRRKAFHATESQNPTNVNIQVHIPTNQSFDHSCLPQLYKSHWTRLIPIPHLHCSPCCWYTSPSSHSIPSTLQRLSRAVVPKSNCCIWQRVSHHTWIDRSIQVIHPGDPVGDATARRALINQWLGCWFP